MINKKRTTSIKAFIILWVMFSTSVFASPAKITFIFLSEIQAQALYKALEKYQQERYGVKQLMSLVQGPPANCAPMGDGCFHPQHGFIPNESVEKKPYVEKKPKPFKLKTINSDQTDLIDCDENNYFGLYCGKAKKNKGSSQFEVWFDVSTSMRRVDYSKNAKAGEGDGYCQRRNFALKLQRECKKGVTLRSFNTGLKEISDTSGLCQYVGLNDVKRLISWINNSDAKELVIITDIDELTSGLQNYLDKISADVHGVGTTAFQVDTLLEDKFFKKISKSCL